MREYDASFLLRVWRDGRGEDAWRASLRDLRSQQVRNFQTLDDLAAHIVRIDAEREEGDGGG